MSLGASALTNDGHKISWVWVTVGELFLWGGGVVNAPVTPTA